LSVILLSSCTKAEQEQVVNTLTEGKKMMQEDVMEKGADDNMMDKQEEPSDDAMMDEVVSDFVLDISGVNFAYSQEEIRVKK